MLEALHIGTQGFSPRTRTDAQLVRFGCETARVGLEGVRAQSPVQIEVTLRVGEAKRALLNGAPLRAAEQLRSSLATLIFTPDRLVVVKGGPGARRAYFDRVVGRLLPARAVLPAEYAAAIAQRNAALRRTAMGISTREALVPWTQRTVALGAQLVDARREVVNALGPLFAARADAFGLEEAELRYEGDPPEPAALEARLEADLERATTGLGPHLHDFVLSAGGRELRRFGSQGEQRLAVLSLLLAEAELLAARGPAPPLLLLDDVLSELDEPRRRTLAEHIGQGTQALVTSTSASALATDPDQLIEVAPGSARSV